MIVQEGWGRFFVLECYASVLINRILYFCPLKGGLGCLMSPPLYGISGLSFDSTLIFPVLFLCLVMLIFLSYLFSACWPILLIFFQKILQHFSLRDWLFCMASVQQLGGVSWSVVCAACCHMAVVFAVMHLYNILIFFFIDSVHFFFYAF